MIRIPQGPLGPQTTGRSRSGPFATLVAEAGRHPEAATALAGCHAELPAEARRALIEAVWADARAAGHDPAPALLALLAVEDDLANARRLRALLEGHGAAALSRQTEPSTWLGGDETRGSAVVIEPLHGPFVEAIGLAWGDGRVTGCAFEPMARAEHVPTLVERWGLHPTPRPSSPGCAVHVIVEVLWHHRRWHGVLPSTLSRLAHLL